MKNFKWYRRWKGGTWFKHQFTEEAAWICSTWIGLCWWARHNKINKYSKVIKVEVYE